MRSRFLWVGWASWLAAAGWTEASEMEQAVPRVHYGVAVCEECRLTLKDKRLGAVVMDADGQIRVFDDPGCLGRYLVRERMRPRKVWMRDFYNNRWIDAYRARYFEHPRVRSERGEEFIASATDEKRPDEVRSFSFDEWLPFVARQSGI